MAHCDAAGVNGSNRIFTHGAPQPRMMPNGCLGSPVLVLLPILTEPSSWMLPILTEPSSWMSDRGMQGSSSQGVVLPR